MNGGLSLHVAGVVGQVVIHTVKNLHGGFAVDGALIGAGLGRPDDGDPFRRLTGRSFTQAELAQDVFVRNAFSASQRSAGAIERGSQSYGCALLARLSVAARSHQRVNQANDRALIFFR